MKNNFHPLNIIVQSVYDVAYFFAQGGYIPNPLKKIEFIQVCVLYNQNLKLSFFTDTHNTPSKSN